jgi:uncharacterized protein (TIGR04222 family)
MDPILDAIRSIPGPEFLIIFLAFIVAGGVLLRYWLRADGSERYPMPSLIRPDPVAVAYLNGGRQAAKRAVLVSLTERGLLEIYMGNDSKPKETTMRAVSGRRDEAKGIERDVVDFFETPRALDTYFHYREMDEKFEAFLASTISGLESSHLVRTEGERNKAWLKVFAVMAFLLTFGGIKLGLGLTYNMPSGYLVLMLVLVIIVFPFVNKERRMTTLGRRYAEELATSLSWAKKRLAEGEAGSDIDLALCASVFGAAALVSLPQYRMLAMGLSPAASAGCGGGCGGGGGGCGGGCGGCGGG